MKTAPNLPEVPLSWFSEINSARQGYGLHSLTIQIESVKEPREIPHKYGPAHYCPRVANWVIQMLDTTPRIAADQPSAFKVTLHKPGAAPFVFGYFDGRSSRGAGLLSGLYAHHCKRKREAKREAKRQSEYAACYWITESLVGLNRQPRKRLF